MHSQDQEHLRLLSIFHYVVAGFAALFALFPIFHLVIGLGMITGSMGSAAEAGELALFGWLFVVFAVVWIVAGLSFAICLVVAGRLLAQRRRYLFCLVIAGLACALTPFGTVLGVFTIIVLMRDSVKRLFGVALDETPAGGELQPAGR